MSAYTNVPTLEANLMAPVSVSVDVMGSSISGGRNAIGESQTIEMSGGGLLTATYSDCKLTEPEQYEYANFLGARFNGGYRFLNVPIISDWYGPFPRFNKISTPMRRGIPHSDGSFFSDTSGYSQATVWGEITAAANLNAGIIKMRVYGLSRKLRWSDWFSIYHETKGWRAYRYWDVLDVTDEENPVYTLALSPPLREAVTAGTRVEFARPRFVAKFKDGFTLPSVVEAFFVTQQTIQFSEAF
ncbi:MAG: hypothetical protein EON58_00740 [Alphaproteobacteria bacterium]|nr:MAG: hypothetical protein EON58_00740 [Alphaproteobacteria bacterium]